MKHRFSQTIVPWLFTWAVCLSVVAGLAPAQRYTPPPPPLVIDPCAAHPGALAEAADGKAKPPVCPPPAAAVPAKPAATEAFPFPGDAPQPKSSAAEQFPFPASAAPTAPAKDAAPQAKSTTDQFPFPGEPGTSSRDGTASSSSSSASDSSPNPEDETSAAAAKPGRRALPKVSAVSPDERAAEDLDVAKFYTDRGNFQAAYLRSKDATKVMPQDADGHFALAQAAEKLHKKEEAATEYALYLKLDPAGEKKALAERALAGLR